MIDKVLDYARFALYALLVVSVFALYQAWIKDHPAKPEEPVVTTSVVAPSSRVIPDVQNASSSVAAASAIASTQPETKPVTPAQQMGERVTVTTDLLKVVIDTRGGDIIETSLLKYPEALNSKSPFVLFNDKSATQYVAESGLLSKTGPDTTSDQALYTTTQTDYSLQSDQDELTVKLNWEKDGVKVSKVFTFARNSYEVKVGYDIENKSAQAWQGNLYTQLLRTNNPPETNGGGMTSLTTYFGAAISSPQKKFEKVTFKDMKKQNLSKEIQGGWAAMIQHYFISAWVPSPASTDNYYTQVSPAGLYTVGMIGPALSVQPGAQATTGAKLYVGPAIASQLEKTAPGLKLTIDYGWFWFISEIIFWMMKHIYDIVGNWGWSIVLVTVVIKLMFYKLSAKSYRSMSKLKKLQPRMEALKERYSDDKQKLTQATMELYKNEKVNPMSGCLPILIQIPVFIALYWVLIESVQLRQAPFIFWIRDLSQMDPYYVLPVLMGISMFIQQRLNPPPPDPMQAKIMMLMPVIFTVMFAHFPAGLMLYWFVNNTLSFTQQWYVMHKLERESDVIVARR